MTTNIDGLNNEELNSILTNEIQALNGGINPDNNSFEENNDISLEEENLNNNDIEDNKSFDEDDFLQEEENEKGENKIEKKIKKLLHQRNEERKEKQSLTERLSEIENKLADTEFYKDNQDAIWYKDDISKIVQERGLTREEAYLLIAWRNILEQNKKINSTKNSMVWITPQKNKNWIQPSDMSINELDSLVNDMYKAWKLII